MENTNTSKDLKILKRLIKLSKEHDNHIPIQEIDNFDSYFVNRLHRRNYIQYLETDNWQANPKYLKVTIEGYKAPYFTKEEIKRFIRRSVLVPIAVSLVTTIIVLLIERFLLK